METRKTTALTIVVSGLRKFTNYSMQVLAFTRMGDGVFTIPTFCQTDEDGMYIIHCFRHKSLVRSFSFSNSIINIT